MLYMLPRMLVAFGMDLTLTEHAAVACACLYG